MIALPCGAQTDWVRNVIASGSATLVHEGAVHEVDRPEVVPVAAVESCFPSGDRRAHRLFAIEACLRVRGGPATTRRWSPSAEWRRCPYRHCQGPHPCSCHRWKAALMLGHADWNATGKPIASKRQAW